MALSAQLGQANLTAESIETQCSIKLEKQPDGFSITESHLDLKAKSARRDAGAIRQSRAGRQDRLPGVEAL